MLDSHRWRVVEALALLLIARLLVARVRFRHWRASLGTLDRGGPRESPHAATHPDSPEIHRAAACAYAVRQAASRLPGTLCLPQAMVLQWMLKRRGIGATVLFGVMPQQERGHLGDLHAWLEIGGIPLLDPGAGTHRVVLRISSEM